MVFLLIFQQLSDGLIVALAEDPSRVSGIQFSTRLFLSQTVLRIVDCLYGIYSVDTKSMRLGPWFVLIARQILSLLRVLKILLSELVQDIAMHFFDSKVCLKHWLSYNHNFD